LLRAITLQIFAYLVFGEKRFSPLTVGFMCPCINGISGSSRVFDYDLYCVELGACLLFIFVPPPTSLIKINLGSFYWAFSVFIYFRFMCVHCAGDLNHEISFVVGS